jgi:hypothetical protein
LLARGVKVYKPTPHSLPHASLPTLRCAAKEVAPNPKVGPHTAAVL